MIDMAFYSYVNSYSFDKELQKEGFDTLLNSDQHVFHYTSALDNILKNSQLRFTNRHYLNDKTEGWYVFDLCINNVDSIWDSSYTIQSDKFIQNCTDWLSRIQTYDKTGFDFYQASFTLENDSLHMWNYYTSQIGYCLEFNLSKIVESLQNRLVDKNGNGRIYLYGKVIYDAKTQIIILRKLIKDFMENISYNSHDKFLWLLCHQIMKLGLFFKNPKFEIENEYRIAYDLYQNNFEEKTSLALTNSNAQNYEICYFERLGQKVPYIDIDFDPSSICSITCSPYENNPIIKLLKNKYHSYSSSTISINYSKIPMRF